MLNTLATFLKILNSETRPTQISLALAFSLIVGFTPLFSLHNLLVILLVLVIRVNLAAFFFGFSLFSGIGYLLDPLFHEFGQLVLNNESMNPLWVSLYNSTVWRLERFNNTIVMGSLLISLVLFIPFVLITNYLLTKYRTSLLQWINRIRIVQTIKDSKLITVYRSLTGVGS
ncbi:MAG: TIGR03546 family protein [Ectothiorhodospiraceae bacterium]|nr:TIGR03546 family protein [Ectothiorhodospiraceae bacterium]